MLHWVVFNNFFSQNNCKTITNTYKNMQHERRIFHNSSTWPVLHYRHKRRKKRSDGTSLSETVRLLPRQFWARIPGTLTARVYEWQQLNTQRIFKIPLFTPLLLRKPAPRSAHALSFSVTCAHRYVPAHPIFRPAPFSARLSAHALLVLCSHTVHPLSNKLAN